MALEVACRVRDQVVENGGLETVDEIEEPHAVAGLASVCWTVCDNFCLLDEDHSQRLLRPYQGHGLDILNTALTIFGWKLGSWLVSEIRDWFGDCSILAALSSRAHGDDISSSFVCRRTTKRRAKLGE